MSKNVIIAIIIILILLVGGWLLIGRNEVADIAEEDGDEIFCTMDAMQCPDGSFVGRVPPNCEFAACPASTGTPTTRGDGPITVTYTDNGFLPEQITINVGDSVTFVNQSSFEMWVASDEHPTHTHYSGTTRQEHCNNGTSTTFDQCTRGVPGTSWTFTFNKAGAWNYHNHVESDHIGTVTVN